MRTSLAAGRPFPAVSPDDVTDYMVTEAVCALMLKQDREAQQNHERQQWKKDANALSERLGH